MPGVGIKDALIHPPGSTNLVTNGGFETNTTGWVKVGTNTIAVSAEQAWSGAQSLKATYQDSTTLAQYAITLTAVAYTASCYLYIPAAYDGLAPRLERVGFTGAAGPVFVSADLGVRDAWQRLELAAFVPAAGDLDGAININAAAGPPTAGKFLYIDDAQVELGSIATPYIHTDGATASRTGLKWVA